MKAAKNNNTGPLHAVNHNQFLMPITQVMDLKSADGGYVSDGKGSYRLKTVEDMRNEKMSEHDEHAQMLGGRYPWDEMHASIRAHGITKPVQYTRWDGENVLLNGHHRAIGASNVGMMFVPAEKVNISNPSGYDYARENVDDDFEGPEREARFSTDKPKPVRRGPSRTRYPKNYAGQGQFDLGDA